MEVFVFETVDIHRHSAFRLRQVQHRVKPHVTIHRLNEKAIGRQEEDIPFLAVPRKELASFSSGRCVRTAATPRKRFYDAVGLGTPVSVEC